MKKVLFATTALIASAGIAAADGHASVTVGGYGFAGVKDDGNNSDVTSKVRLTFSASVETDSGVTFGASARMNITDNTVDSNSDIANGTDSSAPTTLERGKVTISADGLFIGVGAQNGAMRSLARGATFYGFDDGGTLGFDNSTSDDQSDAGNNVYAAYTTGGLTFGISSDVDGTTTEFGVQYSAGGIRVGIAANDSDSVMLAAQYSTDVLDVELGLADDEDANDEIVTLNVNYDVNDVFSVGAAFSDSTANGDQFGLQGSYDLGGASLIGAVGENTAGDSVASLGVFFSF